MEQTKNKSKQPVIKIVLIAVLVYILTFIQVSWGMFSLKDNLSSSCLDCNFYSDNMLSSAIVTMVFVALLLGVLRLRSNVVRYFLLSFLLLLIWLEHSTAIFIDREASWSTFSKTESYYATLSMAYPSMIVLFCVFIVGYFYIDKKM